MYIYKWEFDNVYELDKSTGLKDAWIQQINFFFHEYANWLFPPLCTHYFWTLLSSAYLDFIFLFFLSKTF